MTAAGASRNVGFFPYHFWPIGEYLSCGKNQTAKAGLGGARVYVPPPAASAVILLSGAPLARQNRRGHG
jgi:hypothetical protein